MISIDFTYFLMLGESIACSSMLVSSDRKVRFLIIFNL